MTLIDIRKDISVKTCTFPRIRHATLDYSKIDIEIAKITTRDIAIWGLPFSTYTPRKGGGVKPPIHFHCVLHAKRGWVGPDSMYNCVRTKWKVPFLKPTCDIGDTQSRAPPLPYLCSVCLL